MLAGSRLLLAAAADLDPGGEAGSGIEGAGGTYDEVAAAAAVARDPAARIEPGWTLMERFLDTAR